MSHTVRRHRTRIIMAALAAASVMTAVAWLTGVWDSVLSAPDLTAYPVRGIDISSHNGDVDFDAVAADSIRFVYIKASEGVGFRDPRFHSNYYAARRAGLKVGAYHFYRFDKPADMQAVNLLQMLRGKHLDLPLAIDVEEWTNPEDISDLRVIEGVTRMADYLISRGYPVSIYCNKNDHERYVSRRFRGVPLWICSFIEPDTLLDWTFLQYTHRGSVAGVSGHVDKDVFIGNDSAWQAAVDQWSFTVR